ncbi:galactokinase [Chloroflexota bacterium]
MNIQSIFREKFGEEPTYIARAPGRVNLLGEHVDYNDGPVLPIAIDRSVHLAASPNQNNHVTLVALDLGEMASFELDSLSTKITLDAKPLPAWALYPAGVAWALQDAGFQPGGLKAVYNSELPIGAGLSSSAAIEVGFGVLWDALGGWEIDRLEIARLAQRAENNYVGVSSGLMDQFTSACGLEGYAIYFDTRSLEWEPAPLPPGTSIIVADSGIHHDLTLSAYNERRHACEEAVSILQKYNPDIQSLRDISAIELAAYSDYLPDEIHRRAEHVVKEIARVESALSALHRQDMRALGALMYSGHASLRDLYEVSTPELDTLVDIARQQPGCIGARLTGAGFGGCTVNLVYSNSTSEFIDGLKDAYSSETGSEINIYICQASQGATVHKI